MPVAPSLPTTSNEQASQAVKSFESAPQGYTPPAPSPKEKPLTKQEQDLVDSAMKAPLPMDIGNLLKDTNNEAEKLAAAANPDAAKVPPKDPTTPQEAA